MLKTSARGRIACQAVCPLSVRVRVGRGVAMALPVLVEGVLAKLKRKKGAFSRDSWVERCVRHVCRTKMLECRALCIRTRVHHSCCHPVFQQSTTLVDCRMPLCWCCWHSFRASCRCTCACASGARSHGHHCRTCAAIAHASASLSARCLPRCRWYTVHSPGWGGTLSYSNARGYVSMPRSCCVAV